MNDRTSLQQQLETANTILALLQQKQAIFTVATMPPELQIEISEKERQIESLKARLNQIDSPKTASMPNTLPRRIRFIGRKQQLEKCQNALSPTSRSWGVMIDGIGGMGKTALAVEVAHIAKDAAMFDAYLFATAKTTFLDAMGVKRQKATIDSLRGFITEFARSLGFDDVVRQGDDAERRRLFLEHLHGRKCLLIFDNLETLPDAERDRLTDFLHELPSPSKVIATSRSRAGESAIVIRLERMTPVEAEDMITDLASQSDALQQKFASADSAAKRELYEASLGNPLVLRWALQSVDLKGISIAGALKLLRDADRSGDVYKYLFADTVDRMSDEHKNVLYALADQHDARPEIIAEATKQGVGQVQEALYGLVAVSLATEREERFILHPLMRKYIQDILRGSGVGRRARPPAQAKKASFAMHRQWVAFAARYGGERAQSLSELERELPNIESTAQALYAGSGLPSALEDVESGQLLVNLADILCVDEGPLMALGYWDESIQIAAWAYEAAEALRDWNSAILLAQSAVSLLERREEQEDYAIWYERMRRALGEAGEAVDGSTNVTLRTLDSQLLRLSGRYDEAEASLLEVLSFVEDLKYDQDQVRILDQLGRVRQAKGDDAQAKKYYERALTKAEENGNVRLQAKMHNRLADLAMKRSALDEMESTLTGIIEREGEKVWKRTFAVIALVATKGIMAWLASKDPEFRDIDHAAAKPHYERALELAGTIDALDERAYAEKGLAEILEIEKKYEDALRYAQAASRMYRQSHDPKLKDSESIEARVRGKLRMVVVQQEPS